MSVRASSSRSPAACSGPHVSRRADREAGAGQRVGAGSALHCAGDPEISDERVPILVEQDVLRLDVAVDHAMSMRVVERIGHLAGDSQRLIYRQLRLVPETRSQRLALDERHAVLEQTVALAGAQKRNRVRVTQGGGELNLTPEPLGADGGGELRREDLHDDAPSERRLHRGEDAAHTRTPELALERVGGAQGVLELVAEVCGQSAALLASTLEDRTEVRCQPAAER